MFQPHGTELRKFIRTSGEHPPVLRPFDNSYHNDVIQQRNAVSSTSEEAYWDDRIHYIDMDASNLGGGIAR